MIIQASCRFHPGPPRPPQELVGEEEPGVASDAGGGEAGPVEGAERRPDSPLQRSDSSDAASSTSHNVSGSDCLGPTEER